MIAKRGNRLHRISPVITSKPTEIEHLPLGRTKVDWLSFCFCSEGLTPGGAQRLHCLGAQGEPLKVLREEIQVGGGSPDEQCARHTPSPQYHLPSPEGENTKAKGTLRSNWEKYCTRAENPRSHHQRGHVPGQAGRWAGKLHPDLQMPWEAGMMLRNLHCSLFIGLGKDHARQWAPAHPITGQGPIHPQSCWMWLQDSESGSGGMPGPRGDPQR